MLSCKIESVIKFTTVVGLKNCNKEKIEKCSKSHHFQATCKIYKAHESTNRYIEGLVRQKSQNQALEYWIKVIQSTGLNNKYYLINYFERRKTGFFIPCKVQKLLKENIQKSLKGGFKKKINK